jgi:2'-5' RNA ligase
MNDASFIRYFFALRPDRSAAGTIGRVRDSVGPFEHCVADDRLHVTLGILAELPDRHGEPIARARAILTDISLEACAVALGRLVVGDGIAMLIPTGKQIALRLLQSGLFNCLGRHGVEIRRPENFRPHMTLGYGPRSRHRRTIGPIAWLADQIVLIESWVGKNRHRIVASWPLLPPRQGSFDFDCAAYSPSSSG